MLDSLLRLREFANTISRIRQDGWENVITGLGTSRDKTSYGQFCNSYRLTDQELRALFHQHDTSCRIVSIRPKTIFKEGVKVEVKEDDDQSKAINNAIKKTGLIPLVRNGMIWGGLYGGCLLIAGIDDGKDMSEPLEDDSPIRSIKYFLLLDKRYVYPASYYEEPDHPKYLQVETYGVMTINGRSLDTYIHESRVIRFGGALTDDTERRQYNGWDYSVLQRVYDVVRSNETNFKSVDNLMTDLSQGVFKIKGLINSLMTPKGLETMNTRMQLLDQCRSVARAILLDADHGEEFTRVATPLQQVPDLLDRSMQRTASAAEIPVSILWAQQMGGLNNNAEGEYRHWYDDISSIQKQEVEPILRRIIDWMCRAEDGPTQGKIPDDYEICFPRLWQPTPTEAATIAKTYAERDNLRIQSQIWNASEVALALAKNSDPDRPVEIDTELHETMLENEKELALNGPPEIDPVTGQPLAATSPIATTTNGRNGSDPGNQESPANPAKGNPKQPR